MRRESGHCRQATRTEQRNALLEQEATVKQPIASDRLYEGLFLRRGFYFWHLFFPFYSGGTHT
jgi:hypothetical protein